MRKQFDENSKIKRWKSSNKAPYRSTLLHMRITMSSLSVCAYIEDILGIVEAVVLHEAAVLLLG